MISKEEPQECEAMKAAIVAQLNGKASDVMIKKYITVYCDTCHNVYYYFSPHKDTAFLFTTNTEAGEKPRKHITGAVYDGVCEVYYKIDYWVDE
jgi:hypothetical protein